VATRPGNVRWATRSEQEHNKRANAQVRRDAYCTPWPFGVLSLDKDLDWGGAVGYAQEMLEAYGRGEYAPTPDEEDWLDRHEPGWRDYATAAPERAEATG